MTRTLVVGTGTLALLLAGVSGAAAQPAGAAPTRDIKRLGGSTAFYKPSLTTVASLKRMAGNSRVGPNIRTVLEQAGLPRLTDAVISTLNAANTSVKGGLCSEATPADGTIVECDVQTGQALQWMAYRPKGDATLGLLRDIRWAGRRSFAAFLFRVTADDRTYTFLLPKICGNLTLMSVHDVPRVAIATPPPPPPPPPPAPEPPPPPVVVPPPPPQVQPSAPAPPPPAPVARASWFFIDGLAGKDRRVRPIAGRTTTDGSPVIANAGSSNTDFAQCSPLLGVKIGIAKRFESNWELAGAAGVAFSLVHASDKVREHEVLVDVEANKYLGNDVFFGTGLSLWDVTHSDTFTPAWMLHVGVPLGSHPTHPVHFLTEGRLFLDHASDARNNYQFWAGVRIHL